MLLVDVLTGVLVASVLLSVPDAVLLGVVFEASIVVEI